MNRLAGRRVVVTRAAEQVGDLVERLEAEGAEAVVVPTIAIADPVDGGAALRRALFEPLDWLVVTSSNGAVRVAMACAGRRPVHGRIAAVGPRTAAALTKLGWAVDLVPDEAVGEALVSAFPVGEGRVVLAQAAGARDVVAAGLRAKGWTVDAVEAYRTVPATAPEAAVAEAAGADAVCFLSSSAVTNYIAAAGVNRIPPVVVCIGPITAATAEAAGLIVAAVADEHTGAGVVEALAAILR